MQYQKLKLNVSSRSSVPKYKQVAECIMNDINSGTLEAGHQIPSINELSHSSSLSRDTIQKAYKYLRNKNLIISVKGVGNFINIKKSSDKLNIFFLINKPSSYKMEICNAFVDTIGDKGNIAVSFYYCDENLFIDGLKKSLGMFDYYVIMPHFKNESNNHVSYTDKAFEALQNMPKDKLILLDTVKEGITGNYGAVCQDFKNDIFHALEQASDKLEKYDKIILIYPKNAVFPYPEPIITGFKAFCSSYNFNFEVIDTIDDCISFESKDAYIVIEESDLVDLVQQTKAKHLVLGKDVGVVSYNETPLKSLLDITVISTDFKAMGVLTADLILSNKKEIIKNEFKYIERSSL
ncbi:GntR family transcriptional regulator [Flavobacterium sp. HJJ]|uniref:GntR family transcriptional regulator n=2 Tax=Flavobacterium TaxID=237 RepID=UPI00188D7DC5|nr:GntR family transcriptional regulator [Flavobacterium sp. HJJ]MBF4470958.1 GntR family transcriptional regulator [Flavobacterium sp. HJJ]